MTEPPSAPFSWPVRVYWEDTDAGGVVYYANYLRFLERARTEWLRARGIDQSRMAEETGAVLIVRSVQADFLQSARLDDELDIGVGIERQGKASMVMSQTVHRRSDGALLLTATIKAGCLDAETWTPRRFPPALMAAMNR